MTLRNRSMMLRSLYLIYSIMIATIVITAVCKYDDSRHLLRKKKKNKLSKPNHCRDAILNHHHDKQLDLFFN
jgi:hypothetical protein